LVNFGIGATTTGRMSKAYIKELTTKVAICQELFYGNRWFSRSPVVREENVTFSSYETHLPINSMPLRVIAIVCHLYDAVWTFSGATAPTGIYSRTRLVSSGAQLFLGLQWHTDLTVKFLRI
jgi:hypothetical protein